MLLLPKVTTHGVAIYFPLISQETISKATYLKLSGGGGWDLMIAHPPCTHLAVSGARWFHLKQREQAEALEFVRRLLDAPILKIALENPVSIISSKIRKPTQVIQPWQFGHGETKATCLWLKGLPPLVPTNIVAGRDNRIHRMPPSADRWKLRSPPEVR